MTELAESPLRGVAREAALEVARNARDPLDSCEQLLGMAKLYSEPSLRAEAIEFFRMLPDDIEKGLFALPKMNRVCPIAGRLIGEALIAGDQTEVDVMRTHLARVMGGPPPDRIRSMSGSRKTSRIRWCGLTALEAAQTIDSEAAMQRLDDLLEQWHLRPTRTDRGVAEYDSLVRAEAHAPIYQEIFQKSCELGLLSRVSEMARITTARFHDAQVRYGDGQEELLPQDLLEQSLGTLIDKMIADAEDEDKIRDTLTAIFRLASNNDMKHRLLQSAETALEGRT